MAYARILRKSLLTSSRKYILQHARGLSSAESLPSQADAVIIGGGSIGTSTLYHLQKLGVNAVLIEANKLTSGTTWHSAGLCWQLAGMAGQMDTDIESVQYTKKMVSETLPAETGQICSEKSETFPLFCVKPHCHTLALTSHVYITYARNIRR